jgi:myo-inositol-1(or 4)-monophosphatase
MITDSPNINVMVKAARAAARSLIRDFNEVENLQVSLKGSGDFVSAADRRAEQIIQSELMEARPAYGWIGEELGTTDGKDETRHWVVDPLDGTTNFLHGIPHWAISIAIKHRNEITSAVVFNPVTDELYMAERGKGAWLNDRRLRVSARKEITLSLFATGVPYGGKKTLATTLRELAMLMPQCAGVRRFGAASLDLAFVAGGRYEGYWEREIYPWDIAGGLLLVKEAGGLVTDINGEQNMFDTGSVIAANPAIFEKFQSILNPE